MERLVDLAVAIPLSVAVAARQLVPIGVTRIERRIARDLSLIQRSARRRVHPADRTVAPEATSDLRPAQPVEPVDAAVPAAPARGDDVDLAIDGYDQLSARQIVDRLPSLTPDELAAVEAHERAHRRRQTVLARIAQLP